MKSYELVNTKYFNKDGKEVDFSCYKDIPIIRKVNFINNIVNIVVEDNNYYAILRDLIFDWMLVDVFTDIDVSEIKESPNSILAMEDFIDLGVAEIVKECIDENVLTELNQAVDDAIAYKTGIHKNELLDAMTTLVHSLDNTVKKLESDDMVKIIQKLGKASDDLTTDNIVQSYMKSDMFGKTIKEIKEEHDRQDKVVEQIKESVKDG